MNNHDCIDKGSEFCPCHLAETGDCIICSMLQGKGFCDCENYGGVCIYGEFMWNGEKSKQGREILQVKIESVEIIEEYVKKFIFELPENMIRELIYPGAYVFLKPLEKIPCYDVPISITDCSLENNKVSIIFQEKGIKTKILGEKKEGDMITIRTPYWNGIFGLKNIYEAKNGQCVLIGRGVGVVPLVSIMKKLYQNGNNIILINDRGKLETNLIREHIDKYDASYYEMSIFQDGKLTSDIENFLDVYIRNRKVNLVCVEAVDIINSLICDHIDGRVPVSCSNNTKMCCGEGICGACAITYNDDSVRRYCKSQCDVKSVYEGRRSI